MKKYDVETTPTGDNAFVIPFDKREELRDLQKSVQHKKLYHHTLKVKVTEEQYQELKKVCSARNLTMSAAVRGLVFDGGKVPDSSEKTNVESKLTPDERLQLIHSLHKLEQTQKKIYKGLSKRVTKEEFEIIKEMHEMEIDLLKEIRGDFGCLTYQQQG